MISSLALRRLRVMRSGAAVYDERFSRGVNIIRGENGSGKSTVADFIFYVLGGEFDAWKDSARLCQQVQAEIETASGVITVKRDIAGKQEPAYCYFAPMEDAETHGIDGWHRHPIRRIADPGVLSYSQILFRSAGIPEAPSEGGSNVTAHQILRLLYADQQTPAGKLFRFESFDTRDIRQAVGELMVGINGYELYTVQLDLRQAKAEYADKERDYRAALAGLPSADGLASVSSLDERRAEISSDIAQMRSEIADVDNRLPSDTASAFLAARTKKQAGLKSLNADLQTAETRAYDLETEIGEIDDFLGHLEEMSAKIDAASSVADLLGDIDFTYCPACLQPLDDGKEGHCAVCSRPVDPERQASRYLQIRIDTQLQIRESRQLLLAKRNASEEVDARIRTLRRQYRVGVDEFAASYDVSNSPRESFLAERNKTVGRLERELAYLEAMREILQRVDRLSAERAQLNDKIAALNATQARLNAASLSRLNKAMDVVSTVAKILLRADIKRQEEFENPTIFTMDFGDDAMKVDGKMNFAESSNVILKNSSILALFSAATLDANFWHPRFLLMDNVEDKGMEQGRSHNFQRLIVARSALAKYPHQVIFTTSMLAPELEESAMTVGAKYTRDNKTLDFGALARSDRG